MSTEQTAGVRTSARADPRAHILTTAYALFARRGVRAVGINEIIAESGVAKATFYRHYPSKHDLVLAFLAERERRWTLDLVETGSRRPEADPASELLAIFDVFDEWFARDDFEGCSFINVLLETGAGHPAGQAAIGYLATIRSLVRDRAVRAGLADPEEFARSFHMLMKGSIVAAAEGDTGAARAAQDAARHLIAAHRR